MTVLFGGVDWHILCDQNARCNRGYNQGGDHALDYIRGTSRFVGARFRQRLRYWRFHSPAFGNRRCSVVDSVDSRTKFNLSDIAL